MRVTVERLRFWTLAMTILLVLGVAAFLGYSRWRIRRAVSQLPAKLGVSIEQSTSGFTFSKSEGGHTLFTLHAARTIQYKKGGRAELHDVSIVLYNPAGKPADRISGSDFAYDPALGVVSAQGTVDIDLEAPNATDKTVPHNDQADGGNSIHVRTSGLVFNQKTGIASTSGPIAFQVAATRGSATGASFDSQRGILTVDRDVKLTGNNHGTALAIDAQHAVFDRTTLELRLDAARVNYGASQSAARQATVVFRRDGSASRAEASGEVQMQSGKRRVSANQATVALDAHSHPELLQMAGDVVFSSSDNTRSLDGKAAAGTIHFGPGGVARQAEFQGEVEMLAHEMSSPGKMTRELRAGQVEVNFKPTAHGSEPSTVVASGEASVFMEGAKNEKTTIHADILHGEIDHGNLTSLQGSGNTKLTQTAANGVEQTSTGDDIEMIFTAAAGRSPHGKAQGGNVERTPGNSRASQPQSQIESAEQRGNVVVVERRPPSKGSAGPADVTTIRSGRARFEAANQQVRFSGEPRITNADGELSARTITFDRSSGNAEVTGAVQAVYSEPVGSSGDRAPGRNPVNVIAARATYNQRKKLTTFYGDTRQDARLWQGANSISAPMIELSRASQQLVASGGPSGVLALLASPGPRPAAGARKNAKTSTGTNASTHQGMLEIRSRSLTYLATDRKSIFRGGVRATNNSATMTAAMMTISLRPPARTPPGKSVPTTANAAVFSGAEVERIVASGDVQVEEPGRKATGSLLTYTAADGRFILTGSAAAPPQLRDEVHGQVTGEALIFNDHDDSVIVSGGSSRAVTETRTSR